MKKFLVIQTAFIGDVILGTAVLEKLHRYYPEAQIDYLVRSGNESLLKNHPFVTQVLVWEKKQSKYLHLWRLLKQIRQERYTAVINLQRYAASGFLTGFSRAGEKIGFEKNPLSFLFDKKIAHVIGTKGQPGQHEVDRCTELVKHLTDERPAMPKLYPSSEDFNKVKIYLHHPFITISPASVWFTKQLPAEKWIAFIKTVYSKNIFLLGGPGDKELCETIRQASGPANVVNLSGTLTLLQSAALMSHAKMNYTNDSAPLHLCSAMNAPVTSVFCSTIPEFGFGPLSDVSLIAQTEIPLSCKPCGLHGYAACPLGHFKCSEIILTDITLKEVTA